MNVTQPYGLAYQKLCYIHLDKFLDRQRKILRMVGGYGPSLLQLSKVQTLYPLGSCRNVHILAPQRFLDLEAFESNTTTWFSHSEIALHSNLQILNKRINKYYSEWLVNTDPEKMYRDGVSLKTHR